MEDPGADSGGGSGDPPGPSTRVSEVLCPGGACPVRLLEWKVKIGALVNVDSVLALCVPVPTDRKPGSEESEQINRPASTEKKLKSDRAGVVRELCFPVGQVISAG